MHVREQIAHAVVERIRAVPAFEGRAWAYGAVAWDRRSHPMAIVSGMKSKVAIEDGSNGQLQRRDVEVLVEIYDQETAGGDYVARIGELAVAVEAAVHSVPDHAPVEDVQCLGDTGVTDVDEDERGVRAGTGISFSIAFYTETGNAGAIVAPNY